MFPCEDKKRSSRLNVTADARSQMWWQHQSSIAVLIIQLELNQGSTLLVHNQIEAFARNARAIATR